MALFSFDMESGIFGAASVGDEARPRGTPLDELVPVLIARDRERTTGDAILDNMTARAIGEQWMLCFNGVATRYLDSYLGWRRLIERATTGISARDVS